MIKLFENNVRQKKLTKLHRFNFRYYEVDQNCFLQASEIDDWQSLFGSEFEEIYNNMKTVSAPIYDSGLVLLDSVSSGYPLKNIYMKYAPYKMMSATIGRFSSEIERDKKSRYLKRLKKNISFIKRHHNIPQLSTGVGMVLSIIATKGSSFRSDSRPYIMLLKRANKIRNSQLDVAVVEGLNCSDFNKDTGDAFGKANLDNIAIRALKEERGLQYENLINRDLIHMPKKYYLGLDKDYNQWNFFGTVTIDCTIEEIVREGFYSTIDKYETNEVLGIPMKPEILFHYLSQNKFEVSSSKGLVVFSHKGIWETGWASIVFAFMDLNIKFKSQLFRLGFKKNKRISFFRSTVQKGLDRITEVYTKHSFVANTLSIISASSAIIFLLLKNDEKPIMDYWSSWITKIISLFLAILLAIKSRERFCNIRNFVYIILNSTKNQLDNIQEIPELSVFRNVSILDGNIYDNQKNIILSIEKANLTQQNLVVSAWRDCMAFSERHNNGNYNWVLDDSNQQEHIKWILKYSDEQACIRLVFSLITEDDSIVFSNTNRITNYIDFKVPVQMLLAYSINNLGKYTFEVYSANQKDELKLKSLIEANYKLKMNNAEIRPKTLLKSDGTYVISGFIKIPKEDLLPLKGVIYKDLSTELMSTTFSVFFDDINRVVTELTIAEVIGYKMS